MTKSNALKANPPIDPNAKKAGSAKHASKSIVNRTPEKKPSTPAANLMSSIESSAPVAGKVPSKQQQLALLLLRDEGATLDQMVTLTGWLPHTTRAALTGLKKKGYGLSSDKVDGVRTYRAVAPQ